MVGHRDEASVYKATYTYTCRMYKYYILVSQEPLAPMHTRHTFPEMSVHDTYPLHVLCMQSNTLSTWPLHNATSLLQLHVQGSDGPTPPHEHLHVARWVSSYWITCTVRLVTTPPQSPTLWPADRNDFQTCKGQWWAWHQPPNLPRPNSSKVVHAHLQAYVYCRENNHEEWSFQGLLHSKHTSVHVGTCSPVSWLTLPVKELSITIQM